MATVVEAGGGLPGMPIAGGAAVIGRKDRPATRGAVGKEGVPPVFEVPVRPTVDDHQRRGGGLREGGRAGRGWACHPVRGR